MNYLHITLGSLFLCHALSAMALESLIEPETKRPWSIEWGWNNESYGKSDIHFTGKEHDFTLYGVSAKDTQKNLNTQTLFNTYLNPGRITIPQTNFRLAYQYTPDIAFALNLDHMKYVVSDGQTVRASGHYLNTTYPASGQQYLSPAFMHYEHTDGLNVVTLQLEQKYPATVFPSQFKSHWFLLAGAGIVIPKSNITMTMLGQARNDKFHLAGTALNVGTGFEFNFMQNYFARTTLKAGRVLMTDVVTSDRQDKSSQTIHFKEASVTIGLRF